MVKIRCLWSQICIYWCSKEKSIIFPTDGVIYLYLALYKLDRVPLDGVRKMTFRTKKVFLTVLFERASKMDTSKEKIRYILQFFFDKGENRGQVAENVNSLWS